LTILYEIHDITRFDRVQEFASYAQLVKGQKQSAGKTLGTSGAKMGNVHLKWAFSEAAVLFLRHTKDGKKLLAGLNRSTAKGRRCRFSPTRSGGPGSTCWRGARLFTGEVSRGVAGREVASHTSNSSHGTELGEIALHACVTNAPSRRS
jgi:hypothetical protein